MCLDYVDKEIKKTKGFGWKVFLKKYDDGSLSPLCQAGKFPTNQWLDYDVYLDQAQQGGFHLYRTKRNALACTLVWREIRKCLIAEVARTGSYLGSPAIIARKMKILDE